MIGMFLYGSLSIFPFFGKSVCTKWLLDFWHSFSCTFHTPLGDGLHGLGTYIGSSFLHLFYQIANTFLLSQGSGSLDDSLLLGGPGLFPISFWVSVRWMDGWMLGCPAQLVLVLHK
jgi:hypothetical protein